MSSQQTSGSGRLYRDQARLQPQRPQINGKNRPPSSSSGAVSRVSKSTGNNTKHGPSLFASPRQGPRSPPSELRTSFDPMKDLHLWTMWRVAVNGRIMDDVRKRYLARPATVENPSDYNPFGRSLVKTPLDRFVRVENGSNTLSTLMTDPHGEGGSVLKTEQFVFYGLPRVVLKKSKRTVHLPSDPD